MYRRLLLVTFTVIVLAVFVVPIGVMGAVSFTDVPDDHTFKTDIDWLAAAGVTKGCNPPDNDEFCPDEYVTRAQMAAFMHRLANNEVVNAKTVGGLTADELRGPKGDTGPQGPKGDTGPPGVIGTYVVLSTTPTNHAVYGQVTIALCDNGDWLTGGGYYSVAGLPNHMTMPARDDDMNLLQGWMTYGLNPVYAVCADLGD